MGLRVTLIRQANPVGLVCPFISVSSTFAEPGDLMGLRTNTIDMELEDMTK